MSTDASLTPAVAFVGRSGSGKTTLTEKIISALSARGYQVGSIKHHSHSGFEIDTPGKDSWRHRQAGSVHVVIAAPDQLASIQTLSHELEYGDIIPMMTGLDVVIVEGYRHGGLPTIELFRAENPKDCDRVAQFERGQSIAVVTNLEAAASAAHEHNLPVFGFEDVAGIVAFIEHEVMFR